MKKTLLTAGAALASAAWAEDASSDNTATAFRLNIQLQPGVSGGTLQRAMQRAD